MPCCVEKRRRLRKKLLNPCAFAHNSVSLHHRTKDNYIMKAKNVIAALLLIQVGVQAGFAQKMVVTLTNSQVVKYDVSLVEHITFEDADEHEYVDLGLPSGTLWATCNIGASSSKECGDYFAWGETKPKSDYSWATYKYCEGNDHTMTKYCTKSRYGTVDNKTELEPMDDAATANWGANWQMPSEEQIKELINSSYTTTTWVWDPTFGRLITSKKNSNSIFLPAAGCYKDSSLESKGKTGYYWSRTLNSGSDTNGCFITFYNQSISAGGNFRYYGRSVRAVRKK